MSDAAEVAEVAWLARLRPGARAAYRETLREYVRFTGKDVGGLVSEARRDGGYAALDALQRYVLTRVHGTERRQWTYAALRSFYAHDRAELPRDAAFTRQLSRFEHE